MDRGDADRESRCMTDRDNVIRFNRHLDHARELEREQIRLAKRIAELEFETEQRIGDLERGYAEHAVRGN
jgi:hypothetical protein